MMNSFCDGNFSSKPWPFAIEHFRAFVTWGLKVKNLSPNTIKSYLSSIRLAHTLDSVPCPDFNGDALLKMLLKGGENQSSLKSKTPYLRPAMSINALLILGHKLANNHWTTFSRQVVWAACVTCFFASCRMGEILAPSAQNFDKFTTLQWKHVQFNANNSNNVTIFLPFTKTQGLKGESIDLFGFRPSMCCPVAALRKLKELALTANIYNENLPVFTFMSGKFLTTVKLNKILECYFFDCSDGGKIKFSCHSFRAAIPTLISSHPNRSHVADILEWGRWSSQSYKGYLKLEKDRKKYLFDKIANMLLNSM